MDEPEESVPARPEEEEELPPDTSPEATAEAGLTDDPSATAPSATEPVELEEED